MPCIWPVKIYFYYLTVDDHGNIHYIIEKSYFSNSEFFLSLPGNIYVYELEDYFSF